MPRITLRVDCKHTPAWNEIAECTQLDPLTRRVIVTVNTVQGTQVAVAGILSANASPPTTINQYCAFVRGI